MCLRVFVYAGAVGTAAAAGAPAPVCVCVCVCTHTYTYIAAAATHTFSKVVSFYSKQSRALAFKKKNVLKKKNVCLQEAQGR